MNKKSQHPISIRLTDEVAEKFREYSQNYAKSQGEFIEIMLKRFDETKDLYETNDTNGNSEVERDIWVYTSYLNLYNEKGNQYKAMKKYLVQGRSEYFYPDTNVHLPLNSKYYTCYEELKKEFEIKEDIDNCKFCYWFWILWDKKPGKFLLLEKFSLIEENKVNGDILNLSVHRCKHFKGIEEIRSQISKFAKPNDLMNFDRQYAEAITLEELKDYWV